MSEEKEQSEFGKGLVICLVKFSEHKDRWQSDKETYKRLNERNPELFGGKGGAMSHAVHMHMNGASDHLYEITVPEGIKQSAIGEKVEELKTKGLKMGHGFERDNFTEKEMLDLYDLAEEIAILIDVKLLGINAEVGIW